MNERGTFIAFEGIDGSGKFTQREKTRDWLQGAGYRVICGSEPNDTRDGTELGRTIRKMLKHELPRPQDPYEFQRLYVVHRMELIITRYAPFLYGWEGKTPVAKRILILERNALSTVAYGMLSGRPPEDFIGLHEEVIGPQMIWPDLTILLDLPAEEAIRRIAKGRNHAELFEKREQLENVRANYLKARSIGPFAGKVAVVNGERSEEEVFSAVRSSVESRLAISDSVAQ